MCLMFSPQVVDEIIGRARGVAPDIIAGTLLARSDSPLVVVAHRLLPPVSSTRCRSQITPREYLDAEREARDSGYRLVGTYHSHPGGPAEPSALDFEDARPGLCILIVDVGEKSADATAWILSPDGESLVPMELRQCAHEQHAPVDQ